MSLKSFQAAVAGMAVVLAGSVPAFAQQPKVEVTFLGGWTMSDGVSGDAVRGGDGQIYDRIDPKDSFNWGLSAAGLLGDHYEVGFLFNQQMTTLEAGGTATKEIGDIDINSYHGYFAYNVGESDATVRPYFMFGLGATSYGGVSFTRANGQITEISGNTQLSSTLGAGVKVFPSPNVGVRFGLRWTPTYIKSDADGWWCDPYWGCYLVGSAQYSNQWDFSTGVTFRF
jgi:Outer membrane protein beta-barrel domain